MEKFFCKKSEDSELTNAGFGGNLTETGKMETEAGFSFSESTTGNESIVTKSGFGAASCITNCQNPIRVAADIATKNSNGVDSNGRVPPVLLTGPAADRLVASSGMKDWEQKISKRAKRTYDKYSEILNSNEPDSKRIKPSSDTVGGVVAHINKSRSFLASASSSGGLLLKKDGRVGSAATVGAGFFTNRDGLFVLHALKESKV